MPSCWNGCFPAFRHARTIKRIRSEEDPSGWASPAPWSPAGWETWGRSTTGGSIPEISPSPQSRDFDLHIEEVPSSAGGQGHRRKFSEAGLAQKHQHYHKDFRLEQLLASPGSLPPHQTATQRRQTMQELLDRVISQLPNAPVNEKIAKVPRRLLSSRGAEGQHIRRELLRGATVVWICAGVEGKRFVYEKAHSLGVRSILVDAPDSWSKKLVDEGIVTKFIGVDMSKGSEEVFNNILAAMEHLKDDPAIGQLDGIATVVELAVPLVARVADAKWLPGPKPEHVDTARDKRRTRQALQHAGLPTPANCLIKSEADLAKAAEVVGFPAVLKPISGAASLGVKKVPTKALLHETYTELHNELNSLVVISGALMKGDGTKGATAEKVMGTSFLLEQYLDGDEVDVDVVMCDGEWQYAAVSDNGPTLEPYFNETWAVSPSLLPREKQVALKELAISAVKACGFEDGVFHVECKYTSNGPHLIEVNARMGGGPVYATNLRCWGVDLVEETLLCAVGVPARPNVPREPHECVANCDVNALASGVLEDLSFLETLKGRRGVISFSPHVTVGERVVGPQDGLPTWLVEIVVVGSTPRQALDFLLELEAEVQARVKFSAV